MFANSFFSDYNNETMNSKSAKKTISKELTNYELADLLIKYIDGKFESSDKKINLLGLTMDKKFEASDKKINLLTLTVDKKLADVLMKLEDKLTIHKNLFEKNLNIKVPSK